MLIPEDFLNSLIKSGYVQFYGVPDSLLKSFCECLDENDNVDNHIAVNEGGALASAVGYNLATEKAAVVYLQNSGLGNLINPYLSIVHQSVYAIPVLMIIGWRGEPSKSDEPQHLTQGEITEKQLQLLNIPYEILSSDSGRAKEQVVRVKRMTDNGQAAALLVPKSTFDSDKKSPEILLCVNSFKRIDLLNSIVETIDEDTVIFSTTGKTSRELYEIRESLGMGHANDFLNVGGMGHTSQMALAYAQNNPAKKVLCLDGDGAALMHLGAMAINGTSQRKNFYHILINNGAHESVGGQKTVGFEIDFTRVAEACQYSFLSCVDNFENLPSSLNRFFETKGPSFLEVQVALGSREGLSRPKEKPIERKTTFINGNKGS